MYITWILYSASQQEENIHLDYASSTVRAHAILHSETY